MIKCFSFLFMISGFYFLLDIDTRQIWQDMQTLFTSREKPLRNRILEAIKPKKKRGIGRLLDESKVILKAANQEEVFAKICMISILLLGVGSLLAVVLGNIFLIPVFAIGFSLIPFWYIKVSASKWKKALNDELETALSIITTSYMRSESIITAIEENINYLNPPVADVFKAFLTQTKLINANIKLALEGLKCRIDSRVFEEWVNAVIDCQEDKNLKNTLTPIVTKLSDMRVVSAELDYLLYEPMKEFATMALLLIGNIPLMYFLNRDWFETLVFTLPGKMVLALCAIVLFVSMAAVVNHTKPVEYER